MCVRRGGKRDVRFGPEMTRSISFAWILCNAMLAHVAGV